MREPCVHDDEPRRLAYEFDDEIAAVPTLRDQFAMAALTGVLAANPKLGDLEDAISNVTINCYIIADAMLAAREKRS